jgi:hypothetical protein
MKSLRLGVLANEKSKVKLKKEVQRTHSLNINMTDSGLSTGKKNQGIFNQQSEQLNLQNEQDRIYQFFLKIIKQKTTEEVLKEFQHTIKRCCYILINNWETTRQYGCIQQFVALFDDYKSQLKAANSQKINPYQIWLNNFIGSRDFEQIKVYAARYEKTKKDNWSSRYTPYLLVAQSYDQNNSPEQRKAARLLSRQMKDKFKFELAMYVAYCQSDISRTTKYKNPSILGDNILRIIKIIVNKKGTYSYVNIANIFVRQTQNQTLRQLKDSLQKYLLFYSMEPPAFVESIKENLAINLSSWKLESDDLQIDQALFLRTCNRVIDCLTTENGKAPSTLCLGLLSQGHSLTLVVLLLKIVLISKPSRAHLEIRIAQLITYYQKYPADQCQWLINFMEIFDITFAIYAENVEYNLINMKDEKDDFHPLDDLNDYRVFSQLKLKPENLDKKESESPSQKLE